MALPVAGRGGHVSEERHLWEGKTASPLRDKQPSIGGKVTFKTYSRGIPGGAVVKNLPANAGDTGSSPGLGRSHMTRSC